MIVSVCGLIMSGLVRGSALPHIAQDGEELDFMLTQDLRPFLVALQVHTREDGFSETGPHFSQRWKCTQIFPQHKADMSWDRLLYLEIPQVL